MGLLDLAINTPVTTSIPTKTNKETCTLSFKYKSTLSSFYDKAY